MSDAYPHRTVTRSIDHEESESFLVLCEELRANLGRGASNKGPPSARACPTFYKIVAPTMRPSTPDAHHAVRKSGFRRDTTCARGPGHLHCRRARRNGADPQRDRAGTANAVIICAGGILPNAFLKSVGIEVETRYGTA